ncbi:MAG: DUF3786 domain-containing protein [Oscillospiraceae bacterium]|jgi:hypothetical protein|nr:DUF3786 domain-containing protein [Oscillospiraceae bacterium]MBR6429618.1 DUF3786 domain-containing protein [Oscillospiraceae bacterium]
MERQDHNEMTCAYWREVFLKLDHGDLIRRFALENDEKALYITYFCRRYRIDRETGIITETARPERTVSMMTQMAILNLFYYAKPGAAVCGRFVPYRDVKGAAPFSPAFQKSIEEGLAKPFDGHMEALEGACRALKGEKISTGDVGYVIHAFDWMPVMTVFWDGDEEFPAQANLLFDARITDYLHEESVCCIAGDLMERLREEAEL